jgi:hypothetical protein
MSRSQRDISKYFAVQSDVRFGSKADMCSANADVCYGPKADIPSMRLLMLVELE